MRTMTAAMLIVAFCVSTASARKWADSTGKYAVEAEFLEVQDGKVRLKKDNGSIIAVPIDKLSQADQEFVKSQVKAVPERPTGTAANAGTARRESPAAQTEKPSLPEGGNLPELPPPPAGRPWPEEERRPLQSAVATYREDPVSAYFVFRKVLGRKEWKKGSLSAPQREWLENATKALRHPVESLLDCDYRKAIASADARAAVIAMQVLENVRSEGKKTEPVEQIIRVGTQYREAVELLRRAIQGQDRSPPVWKITDTSATNVTTYSESVPLSTLTVTPKAGSNLVRVKARIENVSPQSDPLYVAYTLPYPLSYMFLVDNKDWNKTTRPRRLASQVFLFLKTADGNIPCQLVCKECETLRGGGGSATRLLVELLVLHSKTPKPATFAGSFVEQGTAFDLDVLFSVPKGTKDLELVFLGSPAVRLRGGQ